ncbi:hypothetical protein JW848_00705 [Candidatus Bipolaricaulota bacterium]|nr:hypothetical protein [Candidatus Bipolaricaulota bacterium]
MSASTHGRSDPDPSEAYNLEALLRQLRATTDPALSHQLQERILADTMPWVEEIVDHQLPPTGFPREALVRAGYLGLLSAVCNWHLSRGKPFRSYADNLIKGEIRQHVRDHVAKPRVPHWLADINRQVDEAERTFRLKYDRLPTLSELSNEINLTEEALAEILRARETLRYVSLDEKQRQNDPLPEIRLERIRNRRQEPLPIELRIQIATALERLGELQETIYRNLFPL